MSGGGKLSTSSLKTTGQTSINWRKTSGHEDLKTGWDCNAWQGCSLPRSSSVFSIGQPPSITHRCLTLMLLMLDKFENGDKIMITKPQRRAILHLKSQKRKIKDKNKDKVMMMVIFPSNHLHKRYEAYHQTNSSNKRHVMGNGECSLTWLTGN